MIRLRGACIVAIFLFFTPDLPASQYVLADIANIRSMPSTKAPIIARLRIATSVKTGESKEDWIQIHTAYVESMAYDINGWIHRSCLTSEPVDEMLIVNKLNQGKTIEDSLPWLERRTALGSDKTSDLTALKDAYLRTKDDRKAAEIAAKIAGSEPWYFACDMGRRGFNILGKIDSANVFSGLYWRMNNFDNENGWDPTDTLQAKLMHNASGLMIQLSGLYWYGLDGRVCYVPRVNRAPADSLLPESGNFIEPYTVASDDATTFFIQLIDVCKGSGNLYTTSKIVPDENHIDQITQLENKWLAKQSSIHASSHETTITQRYGPFRLEKGASRQIFHLFEFKTSPSSDDFTWGIYGWILLLIDGDHSEYIPIFTEDWGS
jgi:hypothetical protein